MAVGTRVGRAGRGAPVPSPPCCAGPCRRPPRAPPGTSATPPSRAPRGRPTAGSSEVARGARRTTARRRRIGRPTSCSIRCRSSPLRRRHPMPASTGKHGGSSDSTPFVPDSTAPAAGAEQGQPLVLAGQPVGGVDGSGIAPRGSIGRNRDQLGCERGRIRLQGQGRPFPSACHAGQLTWSVTQRNLVKLYLF